MGNDHNESDVRSLERRLSSVETNMAKQSDISVITSQMSALQKTHEAIERLTDKIDALITRDAKREESDKHVEQAMARLFSRGETTEERLQRVEIYIAADKPFKDLRSAALKWVLGFVVAGILAAAFTVSK